MGRIGLHRFVGSFFGANTLGFDRTQRPGEQKYQGTTSKSQYSAAGVFACQNSLIKAQIHTCIKENNMIS